MMEVVFLGKWWSVGESLFLSNLILNYSEYLKKNYKGQIKIIYNFINETFIYKNTFDIETLKKYVDSLHFSNPNYNPNQLKQSGYVEIYDWVFVKKENINFFNEVFRYNENCWTKYEIFDEIFSVTHPTNIIRHEVEILYRDYEFSKKDKNHTYPKPLIKLSKNIKKIARDFIKSNDLEEYEVIHFRWNSRYDNICGPEVVEYLVQRLGEVIDTNKKYFISSNYSIFQEKIKSKFSNVYYIDRGPADFTSIESGTIKNKNLPYFISKKILEELPNNTQLSNFIAHVELEIINRSKRVIHCSEISRDIISLFLWYPILVKKRELLWVACENNIIRKYDFDGCIYQEVLEKPKIIKPECFKIISGNKYLN